MSLAWIQNHLALDPQMLERTIQPFGLADGVGRIFLAIEDQGWRVRIADVGVRGVARVDIRVLPGRAEIPFVAGGAAFCFEFSLLIEYAGARHRRFEATGLRNRPFAHFAAV